MRYQGYRLAEGDLHRGTGEVTSSRVPANQELNLTKRPRHGGAASQEVQTTFSLTKDDLVQISRVIRRSSRDGRVFYLFLGLVAVLVVGSGLIARDGARYGLILLELAVLGAMGLVFWLYPSDQYSPKQRTLPLRWPRRLGAFGLTVRASRAAHHQHPSPGPLSCGWWRMPTTFSSLLLLRSPTLYRSGHFPARKSPQCVLGSVSGCPGARN